MSLTANKTNIEKEGRVSLEEISSKSQAFEESRASEGKLEEAAQEFVEILENKNNPKRKRQALEYYRGLNNEGREYIKKNYVNYFMAAKCQF